MDNPSSGVQPGQVYDRLHYVTLGITDEYAVANVRHSIFGLPGIS